MRTAIGLFLLCLSPLALSQGFDPWVQQVTGAPNRQAYVHLHAVDSNTLWGVFEPPWNGTTSQAFLRTTNGGATWLYDTVHAAPSKYITGSIYAFDADRAWVAMFDRGGSGGGLFATTDGGLTWKEDPTVYKNEGSAPASIHFFDADNGVCVGDPTDGFLEIYTTSNGGASWSRVSREKSPAPLAGERTISHEFSAAGSSLWFPSYREKGRFYRTTDKGLTWSVFVNPNISPPVHPAMEFQDEKVGLCNRDWGDVEKTTDGGVTWITIPTTMKLLFDHLEYVPHTEGMYLATAVWRYNSLLQQYQYGTLYTLDAGAHWTIATASAATSFPTSSDFRFSTPTSGWQGDASANIYKWTVPSGRIIGVHPASFVFSGREVGLSSDTVFVDFVNHGSDPVTLSGIVIPGKEFTVTKHPALPVTLPSLGSVRVELCFKPNPNGTHRDSLVFLSTALNSPRASVILEGTTIQPVAEGVIYAASESLYSINRVSHTPAGIGPLDSYFAQGMTIHPGTRVLYGTNSTSRTTTALFRVCCGTAYESVAQTFPVGNMTAIAFDGNGDLYGASSVGRLYRLNVATGDTIGIGTAPGVAYASIAFSPSGRLWASVTPSGSGKDNIYTVNTTTGAATLIGRTGDSTVTRSIFFDPQGRLYGLKEVGDQQTSTVISIDTLTATGTTLFSTGMSYITSLTMAAFLPVGIKAVESADELPKVSALLQNYPNPFNPSTRIRYRVSSQGIVTLKVYDVLGREVAVLVNERKAAGSYEVRFDGAGLPSGVFFYRIEAGDFVQVRKLLLLK